MYFWIQILVIHLLVIIKLSVDSKSIILNRTIKEEQIAIKNSIMIKQDETHLKHITNSLEKLLIKYDKLNHLNYYGKISNSDNNFCQEPDYDNFTQEFRNAIEFFGSFIDILNSHQMNSLRLKFKPFEYKYNEADRNIKIIKKKVENNSCCSVETVIISDNSYYPKLFKLDINRGKTMISLDKVNNYDWNCTMAMRTIPLLKKVDCLNGKYKYLPTLVSFPTYSTLMSAVFHKPDNRIL